jgi:Flp pilus assembly protein TadD
LLQVSRQVGNQAFPFANHYVFALRSAAGTPVRAATALEALQPHSAEALYWSIQANERLAVQSLSRFQQLESDSARSHVLLGDIYHQLERKDDAQAEYLKVLALEPGNQAAMLGLAISYLSSNNIDKAMETTRTALERSPQDPELNMIVAETMVAKSQFAEAEPFLIKSLKRETANVSRSTGFILR